MNRSSATLFGLLCAAAPCAPALTRADAPSTVNADEALRLLLVGNQRFVGGNLNSVTREEIAQRRAELAQGQKPFAIVLCCSDSRVGPEIVFGLKGDPVQNAVRANVAGHRSATPRYQPGPFGRGERRPAEGCGRGPRTGNRQGGAGARRSEVRWSVSFSLLCGKAPGGWRTPRRYRAIRILDSATASWSAVALYRCRTVVSGVEQGRLSSAPPFTSCRRPGRGWFLRGWSGR